MKNENSQNYFEKFWMLFNEFGMELEEGEQIIQCEYPYPNFWFISNMGYVYSVYHSLQYYRTNPSEFRYVPYYTGAGGAKKSDGTYNNYYWFLVYIDKNGKRQQPTHHELVAKHFLKEEYKRYKKMGYKEDNIEIHHIIPIKSFNANESQNANRVDNLQVLPKSIHKEITKLSNGYLERKVKNASGRKSNDSVDNDSFYMALDEIVTFAVANPIEFAKAMGGFIAIKTDEEYNGMKAILDSDNTAGSN